MEKQEKNTGILNLTETAVDKFYEMIQETKRPGLAVRIRRQDYQTQLLFAAPEDINEDDVILDNGKFNLVMDPQTADLLDSATLDIQDGGFTLIPAAGKSLFPKSKVWGEPTANAVQEVIDQELNPGLASHSGWVKLLEVKEETVYIEMGGGCRGCMQSYMTLKDVIERSILEKVPAIQKVLDTTDHAGGTNPFYEPAG